LKKLRGCRHYIWEMDLFPDALTSLNVLRADGIAARLLGIIADFSRHQAEGIIALGPCMRGRLIARGIPAAKIHICENWADGRLIRPQPYRKSGRLHVLYSGNLGLSHDIETVATAMLHFRNDERFLFTFAGGGARRAELEQLCHEEGIENARFRPYCAREDVGESLGECDIGLVTERPACIGTVVPSKV
jgi:hypothetical protein